MNERYGGVYMNIYMVFAVLTDDVYENRMRYLLFEKYRFNHKDNKTYVGLYAWTTKKKYLKGFLKDRDESIYIIKERFMTESEFLSFKDIYEMEKIVRNDFDLDNNGNVVEMFTTKNEYVSVYDNGNENLEEIMSQNVYFDYTMFTDDIIRALDIIGYCSRFDILCDNIDRVAEENFNESFGLTRNNSPLVSFTENKVAMLLFVFKPMFMKMVRI